jgi:hypothetical protein
VYHPRKAIQRSLPGLSTYKLHVGIEMTRIQSSEMAHRELGIQTLTSLHFIPDECTKFLRAGARRQLCFHLNHTALLKPPPLHEGRVTASYQLIRSDIYSYSAVSKCSYSIWNRNGCDKKEEVNWNVPGHLAKHRRGRQRTARCHQTLLPSGSAASIGAPREKTRQAGTAPSKLEQGACLWGTFSCRYHEKTNTETRSLPGTSILRQSVIFICFSVR